MDSSTCKLQTIKGIKFDEKLKLRHWERHFRCACLDIYVHDRARTYCREKVKVMGLFSDPGDPVENLVV